MLAFSYILAEKISCSAELSTEKFYNLGARRRMNALSGDATVKIVFPLFWKGVYSKTKEIIFFSSISFLENDLMCRKANRKSHKLPPLYKTTKCIHSPWTKLMKGQILRDVQRSVEMIKIYIDRTVYIDN